MTVMGFFLFTTASRPAPCPMGTTGSYPGVKQLGHKAKYSSPPSSEVKNLWSSASIPLYIFMVWCLVKHGLPIIGKYYCISNVKVKRA
jgi:hypothetical protein